MLNGNCLYLVSFREHIGKNPAEYVTFVVNKSCTFDNHPNLRAFEFPIPVGLGTSREFSKVPVDHIYKSVRLDSMDYKPGLHGCNKASAIRLTSIFSPIANELKMGISATVGGSLNSRVKNCRSSRITLKIDLLLAIIR